MACKNDFERYLECKGDEIDNAAYALAVALLRTHPDQTDEEVLPWDMAIIAPVSYTHLPQIISSGMRSWVSLRPKQLNNTTEALL